MTESQLPSGQMTTAAETTPSQETAGAATPAAGAAVPATGADAEAAARPPAQGVFWGTGRRKCAVARVRIMPGQGRIVVNKRPAEQYFREPQEQNAVRDPLLATNTLGSYDVLVNVQGGGHSGQAGAVRLGIARALVKADPRHEAPLRERGFLTRDARVVERKKYGRRKARRRFQFSKR